MIRERCSCSAEIETDEPKPGELVTAWRQQHRCLPLGDRDTAVSGHIENAIGFRIDGLALEIRQEHEAYEL